MYMIFRVFLQVDSDSRHHRYLIPGGNEYGHGVVQKYENGRTVKLEIGEMDMRG